MKRNNFTAGNPDSGVSVISMKNLPRLNYSANPLKPKRIGSIDLLRGAVMIIMALDHVRHAFHYDAFHYEPTNLELTTPILFFTRFITHFCAPVFVFLAGISAYLYGLKKSRNELAYYLFSRGLWLVFVELFIITLGQTFNPSLPYFNLQVIWAIGISMIALSLMIYMQRRFILMIAILLIAGHNLLDDVHVAGNGAGAFLWAVLHEPKDFVFGHLRIYVMYPLLPWIGILALGYSLGNLYDSRYAPAKRRDRLLLLGVGAITLFFVLRAFNIYGDAAHWSVQKDPVFSFLSILNVTKYPPSLLYTLITLGPAMIFLAFAEKPLNALEEKISVYGRVPFFYYVAHLYLIHFFAMIGAIILGFPWSDMVLTDKMNRSAQLKTYGYNLLTVYLIWIGLVILLYPLCKWFDRYKRKNVATKRWLSYT